MQAPLSLDCPRCKLPVLPETISLEKKSLLLATLHCRCHKSSTNTATFSPSSRKRISVYSSRCRNCGKKLVTTTDKKILTSFFFKPYTCHCQNSEHFLQVDETDLEDQLSWQYHLKGQAQTRRRTRFENQALSKTKLVLSASDRRALIELKPGELIANTYILEEQIGEGGMGLVFKARHQLLGRLCALKFLAPSAISPQSWEFFKREAKILNDLSHPAISLIYDMGLHKNALPFIAMELLQGTTLEELLVKENTLCLGAAIEIFVQVAGALSYAHRQKIIHKDIKPANIMLTLTPTGQVSIKLLDFGIAELEDKNYLAANANDDDDDDETDIVGSACYMSPEQFTGEKLTAATDIYSLGCSLFECLTGTLPFDGEEYDEMEEKHKNQPAPTLKAVTNSDFPVEIEAVLHKAMQKEPARRYRYISEMVVDLERILEGKPLQFAKTEEFLAAQGGSQNTNNKSNNIYTEALVAASLLICIPAFATWKILSKETTLQTEANYEITDDLANSRPLKSSASVLSPGQAVQGKDSEKRPEKEPRKTHQLALNSSEIDNLYETGGLDPSTQIKGPLSKVVQINGKKKRVFTFPTTYSLGYIAEGYFSPPEQAIGKKIYPASSAIAFYADPSLGDNPEVYKYFDNKAISFLSVIRATKLPEVKVLSQWQNLHILRFRKCIITLAYFKALKDIPQLNVLMLDQNEFNNQDLIDSKLLNTIQALNLVARGEDNLNFLNVLQSLEKAPQQPDLSLCGQISKEETAVLSRLKKMKKLSLKDTRLTDNQLTLLCQMQFLKELTIDKTCLTNCSSGAIVRLKQSLSGMTQVSIVESQTQE